MSTRRLQIILSLVFFGLGGWCVVAPGSVLNLGFRPSFQSQAPIVPFLMVCFGLQALIAGTFALTSRFTRTTFLVYGIGLIPFFALDVWFFAVQPVLTWIGFGGDVAGNLIMAAICWVGFRRTPAEISGDGPAEPRPG